MTRPPQGERARRDISRGTFRSRYTEARVASTDLTEIQPAEYRADVVVLLLDRSTPVRVIVIEVQLAADPRKRLSWPAYVTVSRAIHGCPADLLVVAPDPALAAWSAEPIEIGVPGFVLTPPVLHRTAVPVVTDPGEAARRPELGVLSAMSHGDTEQGATLVTAVLPAILGPRQRQGQALAVPDAARERILARTDPERLERWLEKATLANTITAVFDEPN